MFLGSAAKNFQNTSCGVYWWYNLYHIIWFCNFLRQSPEESSLMPFQGIAMNIKMLLYIINVYYNILMFMHEKPIQ